MTPKEKGYLSELAFIARAIELGYTVSVPCGDNARYDVILEKGGSMSRVQIKTGRVANGIIRFHLYSTGRDKVQRSYDGDVEFIGVSCAANRKLYLVPMPDISGRKTAFSLRLAEAKNKNRHIRMAEKYEF